jgi:hypothetical protein
MYENRVLERIFGPNRDEVMGGWRKLHNEGFDVFYYSLNIIRMMKPRLIRWDRVCSTHGRKEIYGRKT